MDTIYHKWPAKIVMKSIGNSKESLWKENTMKIAPTKIKSKLTKFLLYRKSNKLKDKSYRY